MPRKKMKRTKKWMRHKRVRAKVIGTSERPRLCVFRSAKHIYAQLIDDEKGRVVVSASDRELKKEREKGKTKSKDQKTEKKSQPLSGKVTTAFKVGGLIAKKAEAKKITKVVFDRGGYKYHGRVKSLAEGAREGGLKF